MSEESKEKSKSSRSLILVIEDAKMGIVNAVNDAINGGLPCYIVADVLAGVLSQVREGARKELEIARQKEAQKEVTE